MGIPSARKFKKFVHEQYNKKIKSLLANAMNFVTTKIQHRTK